MISLDAIRSGATRAITLLEKFFGIPCEIYYPKGFDRSGRTNNVTYGEEADLVYTLLLLDPYTNRMLVEAGAHTNFGIELYAYVPHDVPIYRYSKIVATLKYTMTKYKVEEITGHNDIKGKMYQKLHLSPITELSEDDEVVLDENKDYIDQLIEDQVNMANVVSDTSNSDIDEGLTYSPFVRAYTGTNAPASTSSNIYNTTTVGPTGTDDNDQYSDIDNLVRSFTSKPKDVSTVEPIGTDNVESDTLVRYDSRVASASDDSADVSADPNNKYYSNNTDTTQRIIPEVSHVNKYY